MLEEAQVIDWACVLLGNRLFWPKTVSAKDNLENQTKQHLGRAAKVTPPLVPSASLTSIWVSVFTWVFSWRIAQELITEENLIGCCCAECCGAHRDWGRKSPCHQIASWGNMTVVWHRVVWGLFRAFFWFYGSRVGAQEPIWSHCPGGLAFMAGHSSSNFGVLGTMRQPDQMTSQSLSCSDTLRFPEKPIR